MGRGVPRTRGDTGGGLREDVSGMTFDGYLLGRTLQVIGGKYKGLILWSLLDGALRFSGLRRAVPCATPKMLTQQLRELETDGLISRTVYPVVPPKVEYALTDLGKSLHPVLEAMHAWGSAHLARQAPRG